jgi:PiT family inorganic phosphate transporter
VTAASPFAVVAAASRPRRLGILLFTATLLAGALYAGSRLLGDLAHAAPPTLLPYLLLGVALLIALGFEFVNGFHDTANAVATVIYTHSLPPPVAVIWSGAWNFAGVLLSSGAVAFTVVALLPVELILQVGSSAGFAMVFALLIAAIIWNLGTWSLGLPASSSHTLIGSIIGVGLANQLMAPGGTATSGVDWRQAEAVGWSLLLSPLAGFVAAGLLLVVTRRLVRAPELYRAPEGRTPPPPWIRGLLILTCTGVSFAHGSNDGQKGMGLIMLILIGTVPTAYALNKAVRADEVAAFAVVSERAVAVLERAAPGEPAAAGDPRPAVDRLVTSRRIEPESLPAVARLAGEIARQVAAYKSLAAVPPELTGNIRNDMYLVGEALRRIMAPGGPSLSDADRQDLATYRAALDRATKFIPIWVKIAVAIALGLGTMVGWKRIVVTVGEKIGKSHLTYAQGGSAELVAMAGIGAADSLGLPVSTTHVLSSGIAGTMAANGSGLQWRTLRQLLMAWVLTLPASIVIAGALFWLFRHLF